MTTADEGLLAGCPARFRRTSTHTNGIDRLAVGAARLVDAALVTAPAGNAGWLVPIEPLLHVQRDRAPWAPVLARLRTRAS